MKKISTLLLSFAALSFAAASAKTVNIGYSGPLSGGAASYGKDIQTGLEMAVKEINAAGGITVGGEKVTFNLVSLDDRYLPNETATNTKRLTDQGIDVIYVTNGGAALAIQPLTTRTPNFLMMAYSTDPRVVEANNPLTLMLAPRYDNYGPPYVKKEMAEFGKRLGTIAASDSGTKNWTAMITAEWKKQGGTVLSDNSLDYNTTVDFSSAVTKALAEKPDVINIGGASQPTALVIKAAREQGFKGGFILSNQPKIEEMTKIVPISYLNGAVGITPLAQLPGTQLFINQYTRLYKKAPNYEASTNYTSVYIIATAMQLAGTTDDIKAIRAKLSQAALSLPITKTLVKIISVTPSGLLDSKTNSSYIKDGKFVKLPIPTLLK